MLSVAVLPIRPTRSPSEKAFTLVELLVVIGIIALLISILLPTLGRTREMARRIVCSSNLRQIAMATFMYEQNYKTMPGPVIPCALDPLVVNASPSLIDFTLNGNPQWYRSRNLASDDKLHGLMKNRQIWFCPSGQNLRENAVPVSASSPFVGRKLQYGYLCNNQPTSVPKYFFGYWYTSTTLKSEDFKPKKVAQCRQSGTTAAAARTSSEIWMYSDIDGPLLNTNVASNFSIAKYTGADFESYPWQPVHESGRKRGRSWVFFDGHAEYRSADRNPADPLG